jgi:UDP-N-acetylglucosamine--N-acetylmuramyl-(pentapeptide) pyrophosphoryl-undecaprenol N-acetylglucosamine transferase
MSPRVLLAGGGTGGHLYPAINLAAALRALRPDVELMLVGASRGIEASVLPGSGVPFRLLPMEPFRRARLLRNWRLAASAPAVLHGIRRVFNELDPDVVVGTGGYASGPAVLCGLLTGRKTALQEQNAFPGLVTRKLAPKVDRIFLGYPESIEHLAPGEHTEVLTWGNPVAAPRTSTAAETAVDAFRWPSGRVVAVIGGSQGARGLNERLLADLAAAMDWPADTTLVWITGPNHHPEVSAAVSAGRWADRILTVPYVDDLGARLSGVDLAVCRSGAMFCSELSAAGIPAVLVPFPAAAADHQRHNAAALAAAGAAVMLEERSMQRGELWDSVLELMREEDRLLDMSDAMRERGQPDAAERIARELLDLAELRVEDAAEPRSVIDGEVDARG